MAIIQRYRVRYIEYIRKIIGDEDQLLFSDDELKSSFDKWSCQTLTTTTARADNNRYKSCGCCGTGTPLWELAVSSGTDGAVYIIDEASATIWFDPDDPLNTAVAPVDGTTIEVTFYTINTPKLISELYLILSSNHAKLKLAHSILGVQMDLTKLSDSFYNQSIRWELEGCNF